MKQHLIVLINILILISCSFNTNGQSSIPKNEEIRLYLKPRPIDGRFKVNGMVENLSTKTFHLNYVISINERNNTSYISRQKNKFQLDSLARLEIGEVSMPYNPKAIYDFTFEIFHDTTLISFMSMSNEVEKPIVGMGLIINSTRSKNGNDFYKLFNKYWLATGAETNVMIKLEEKPARSTQSFILVYVNNNVIMQQMLGSRYNQIDQQAKYGLDRTIQYLVNNPNLSSDSEDLLGNGMNE